MTRIVAGAARGRTLTVPPGSGTRPTSDRVREALFSALGAQLGGFEGLRVLDLYAGSGALGLEALSRGAGHCLLVESDARAARTIRSNITHLGLREASVVTGVVERVLQNPPAEPYHLVLADPPYALSPTELTTVLTALTEGWLAAGAVIVVERDRRGDELNWPPGIVGDRERRYGETMLWYGHSPEASLPTDSRPG